MREFGPPKFWLLLSVGDKKIDQRTNNRKEEEEE